MKWCRLGRLACRRSTIPNALPCMGGKKTINIWLMIANISPLSDKPNLSWYYVDIFWICVTSSVFWICQWEFWSILEYPVVDSRCLDTPHLLILNPFMYSFSVIWICNSWYMGFDNMCGCLDVRGLWNICLINALASMSKLTSWWAIVGVFYATLRVQTISKWTRTIW